MPQQLYQKCIEACQDCATACQTCATSCLQEEQVPQLTKCIRLDLECAAICNAAAQIMSLDSEFSEQLCHLCIEACDRCAKECAQHDDMDHCRLCAEACRNCAEICSQMSIPVTA